MSKKCTPLWREDARSTFPSQNVQNTPAPDHFWQLRCRKSARRCGAKHISKSKCTKHLSVGQLLDVEMSKKCTPLWREAHLEVKMCKTPQCRTTFGSSDLEKVHAVVARSTFGSQNVKNRGCKSGNDQRSATVSAYTRLRLCKSSCLGFVQGTQVIRGQTSLRFFTAYATYPQETQGLRQGFSWQAQN